MNFKVKIIKISSNMGVVGEEMIGLNLGREEGGKIKEEKLEHLVKNRKIKMIK